MLSYNKFLTEGVYDPHIFKAFFLAGGPGSGKSYVQRRLFAGTGMKVVNSDNFLTNSLKKAGQSLDLRSIEGGILDAMRGRAKKQTGNQMDLLSNGFKMRGSNVDTNGNGSVYIYMAFAKQPGNTPYQTEPVSR